MQENVTVSVTDAHTRLVQIISVVATVSDNIRETDCIYERFEFRTEISVSGRYFI